MTSIWTTLGNQISIFVTSPRKAPKTLPMLHRMEDPTPCNLRLFSFWPGVDSDEGLIRSFARLLHKRARGYREVQIWSCHGPAPKRREPDVLYVQYTGESYYHKPDLFDVNLLPAVSSSRTIPFPMMAMELMKHPSLPAPSKTRRISDSEWQRKKFCVFVVSNPWPHERKDFFRKLSNKYKQVDSWGNVLNNQDGKRPFGDWWTTEYHQFLSQYKFMICFENKSQDYYLTEKLSNAYFGGTIPIYWGCPQATELLNGDSFLHIPGKYTSKSAELLIEKVAKLDTDIEAYRRVYEQPLFRDQCMSDCFDPERVADQIAALG